MVTESLEGTHNPTVPRILVVGCGVSGRSVAQVYLERGAEIHILDAKPKDDLLLRPGMNMPGMVQQGIPEDWFNSPLLTFWLDGQTPPPEIRFDEVVVSPGVPWSHPLLNRCRSQGSIVRGELEWALLQIPGRVVVVTGSNGKTTTSLLLYHLLCSLGNHAFLVGNVGTPVSSLIAKENDPDAILVVEASSYQLEASLQFAPEVGLFLNISENHLERHGTLDGYINAKLTAFRRMKEGAMLVTSEELEDRVRTALKNIRPDIAVFGSGSAERSEREHFWADTGNSKKLIVFDGIALMEFSLEGTPLIGEHNRRNCAAAVLGILALGIPCDKQAVERALRSFKMPLYRIQESGTSGGVTWINDSKSTTPEATRIAILSCLESYSGRTLTLLFGGEMKNASWDDVWSLIVEQQHRISSVIVFGGSARRLYDQMSEFFESREVLIQIAEVPTLRKAIQIARQHSVSGDVVVFSPGCASFDEFRNFEDRGAFFDQEAIIKG